MNTRRTFLQSLAAIPLLGRAFASPQPAMTIGVDVAKGADATVATLLPEPVYGFTENKMLSDLYGNRVFVYGEKVCRGDMVAFSKDGSTVVKATLNSRPIGLATVNANPGDDAQDTVLVQGELGRPITIKQNRRVN